jgi:multidrug efflux pump subunit AcrA (membrane-fusion protein)
MIFSLFEPDESPDPDFWGDSEHRTRGWRRPAGPPRRRSAQPRESAPRASAPPRGSAPRENVLFRDSGPLYEEEQVPPPRGNVMFRDSPLYEEEQVPPPRGNVMFRDSPLYEEEQAPPPRGNVMFRDGAPLRESAPRFPSLPLRPRSPRLPNHPYWSVMPSWTDRPARRGNQWLRRRLNSRQQALALLVLAAFLGGTAVYVAIFAGHNGRSLPGVVLSNGVVDLNFASTGQVANIAVHVGQQVKAGQVLATESAAAALAVVAADQATVAADKATLAQISSQAAPGAAALAGAQAKLASDQARLVVEQAQLAGMQIQAPMAGLVIAVNGQVGETVTAAAIRDDPAKSRGTSASRQSALSLLGTQSAVAGAASVPVIALRTSGKWQVDMMVPTNSTVAVKPGEAVTVAVPAAGLSGVHGRIDGLLPTPLRTSQGLGYQAIVTVLGQQPVPPVSGMAAEVTLAS